MRRMERREEDSGKWSEAEHGRAEEKYKKRFEDFEDVRSGTTQKDYWEG